MEHDEAEVDEGALSWQERALCAQTDPEAFFPEKGGSTREAKKVCLSCDVRSECLEYALGHDERFGIWADSPSASGASSRSARSNQAHAGRRTLPSRLPSGRERSRGPVATAHLGVSSPTVVHALRRARAAPPAVRLTRGSPDTHGR